MKEMSQDIERVLFDSDEIDSYVSEIAGNIEADLREQIESGERIIFVGVLRGAATFMIDLVRKINLPIETDFLYASSYGNSATSTGEVKFDAGALSNLDGAHVVIVEDIIDTGLTMKKMADEFCKCGAKSVRFCALIVKDNDNQIPVNVDYTGPHCPNEFIVGYGLDYAEKYRNLPYIGVLKREIYE